MTIRYLSYAFGCAKQVWENICHFGFLKTFSTKNKIGKHIVEIRKQM